MLVHISSLVSHIPFLSYRIKSYSSCCSLLVSFQCALLMSGKNVSPVGFWCTCVISSVCAIGIASWYTCCPPMMYAFVFPLVRTCSSASCSVCAMCIPSGVYS